MPVHRNALLAAMSLAVLSLAAAPGAVAQKYNDRGVKIYQTTPMVRQYKPPVRTVPRLQQAPKPAPTVTRARPTPSKPRVSNSDGGRPHRGGNRDHRGHRDRGGYPGGGFGTGAAIGLAIGTALPAIVNALPRDEPPPGRGRFIDNGSISEPIDRRRVRRPVRRQQPRRVQVPMPPPRMAQRPSGAPPPGETRLVPDEVVIELSNAATPQQITALQNRFRLERIESHRFVLSDTTLFRWRIPDNRSIPEVIRSLEQDRLVASAQPNYLYALQQTGTRAADESGSAQYALAKLHLLQAHQLAKGDNVRVAVINSAIDLKSPELAGSIAGSFDTLKSPRKPHAHGTSVAGLIAAHGQLTGVAPGARILAVRAFDPDAKGAQGSTFNILKGLDWSVQNKARIINMSFAGPADPALHRALQAADKRGIVLIAAAGNAGPKSPPLYPAAYEQVIAVSATDAEDKLLEQSNRGQQIALAAPGKDVLVALPDGGVEVSSGTSWSAAEVSGVAALLIQRDASLASGKLRDVLESTARDLGPKGRDPEFGYGLVNAFDALTMATAPVIAEVPHPVSRVSTGGR